MKGTTKHNGECACKVHQKEIWEDIQKKTQAAKAKAVAVVATRTRQEVTSERKEATSERRKIPQVNEKWVRSQSIAATRSRSSAHGRSAAEKKAVVLEG